MIARGFAADEIDAVLSTPLVKPLADVKSAHARVKALASVRSVQPEVFAALAEAFKRAKNIVGRTEGAPVQERALVEDAERDLFAAIRKAESSLASDPASRLRAVAAMRGEVDAFFKSVMVMADDPALKANRLALLSRLLNLVYEVADLSTLASAASDKTVSS